MANTFVHFEIPVDDVARAQAFYKKVFGWRYETYEAFEGYSGVLTSDEEGALNGGMMAREMPNQTLVFYINVDSLDATLDTLRDAGGEIVAEKMPVPGMGWMAHFRDPEGNVFGLWQEDPSAG